MARDSTGCINLLRWEREVKSLFGKTTDKMKEEVVQGDDEYPPSLNKLLDRLLLIKIHVKSSNIKDFDHVYPVIKIVDDEEFIKNYKPPNNNVTGSADIGQSSNLSFETQGNVVNLISDNDPHYSVQVTLDESVPTVEGKTPAKRASPSVNSASPQPS
ncbi:hypothetical protein PIB30_100384 [Stylosanthes scabra]|uniref:Uncharacterized protein n=1 Tax=Stylosanthes scabra TaxID=79078 RepID=A0ABU6ZW89_9FABA|nr:hypothetical protein [Stylosanthes scabra]